MERKISDEELIRAIRRGNENQFEELLSRYTTKVFSLATRLTRNREDAEEVLQDVFTTVHRKLKGFEGKSSFSSWLYRITVNTSLMKLRKRKQDRLVGLEEVFPEFDNSLSFRSDELKEADAVAQRQQLLIAIESAIEKLPAEYRPVYVLRDIDGLTSHQVGKMLKLSVPAVKSRLHRSRMMLRRRLLPLYREIAQDAAQNAAFESKMGLVAND